MSVLMTVPFALAALNRRVRGLMSMMVAVVVMMVVVVLVLVRGRR